MRELYEFRILERHAAKLLKPKEGKQLGELVRKIQLQRTDPRFSKICELNLSLSQESNDMFFAGWDIKRFYTAGELARAELFLLHHIPTFEPAGEECGTRYDEASGCPNCTSGAKQVGPLFLDLNSIPKGKDIARTISGEVVVSKQFRDAFEAHGLIGAKFAPVRYRRSSSATSEDWLQLVPKEAFVEITSRTEFGINPCDGDLAGEYRCPLGDLIGLARLSEVWLSGRTYHGQDFVASRQFVGLRRGFLRPERLLFISHKCFDILKKHKLHGLNFEIAYF